jgi:hypothetical protein
MIFDEYINKTQEIGRLNSEIEKLEYELKNSVSDQLVSDLKSELNKICNFPVVIAPQWYKSSRGFYIMVDDKVTQGQHTGIGEIKIANSGGKITFKEEKAKKHPDINKKIKALIK